MRSVIIVFGILFLNTSYSQKSSFGIYQLKSLLPDQKLYGTILKLNCDYTYFREGSTSKDWGTWKISDAGIFILNIDTMSNKGKTERHKIKVFYKFIDDRLFLHEKEYSKQAFKKFIRDITKNYGARFDNSNFDKEYENYRRSSMSLYFEKKESFVCQ